MGDLPPTVFQDPVITFTPCWRILLASSIQFTKYTRLLILLLHRRELQWERLAVFGILLHLPWRSPQKQHNNSTVVQVMDLRLSECHILKELCIYVPSNAVIWLGLMPLTPPLLLPSPSCSPSLSSTLSLDEFTWLVNEVHFVKQIRNDRLPLSLQGPKIDIRSPSSSGLQFAGHLALAAWWLSTPIVSVGGGVHTHYKKLMSPHDQLKCQNIGGGSIYHLNLKVSMSRPPKHSDTALLQTCWIRRNHVIPRCEFGISIVGELGIG